MGKDERENQPECSPDVPANDAADVFEFHGFVHEQLRREREAFLLPILALVNARTNDLFDQVLGISSMNGMSVFDSSIRHLLMDCGYVLEGEQRECFFNMFHSLHKNDVLTCFIACMRMTGLSHYNGIWYITLTIRREKNPTDCML